MRELEDRNMFIYVYLPSYCVLLLLLELKVLQLQTLIPNLKSKNLKLNFSKVSYYLQGSQGC